LFFPSKAFVKTGGKIFFFRGRLGATYEVSEAERAAIIKKAYDLHWKMAALIVLAFGGFGIFVIFLPDILFLPFAFAMAVMGGLTILSLLPLGLMLKFHLDFQTQVREVLGDKTAVDLEMTNPSPEKPAEGTPEKPEAAAAEAKPQPSLSDQERSQERKVRFFWVFFLGIIITTIGATMLFGSGELETKMLFIWTVWTMTGLGFLVSGVMGIYYRFKDDKSGERKFRD